MGNDRFTPLRALTADVCRRRLLQLPTEFTLLSHGDKTPTDQVLRRYLLRTRAFGIKRKGDKYYTQGKRERIEADNIQSTSASTVGLFSRSKMLRWLFDGRPASGVSRKKEVCSSYVRQSASDIAQPIPLSRNSSSTNRTERKGQTLLSAISAVISLSSSLLAGPLVVASAGQTRDHTIEGSWLASRHLKGILSFLQPDPGATPSIQQVTGVSHIFCLSILVLYRSRKTDPYQNTIIILVTLLGISLNLFLGLSDPHTNIIDQLIMILPCMLSLGTITSAGLHTIWLSFCADMGELDEESRGDRKSKYRQEHHQLLR